MSLKGRVMSKLTNLQAAAKGYERLASVFTEHGIETVVGDVQYVWRNVGQYVWPE
jgi:hypothetical protein